jgi:hypothetical protein
MKPSHVSKNLTQFLLGFKRLQLPQRFNHLKIMSPTRTILNGPLELVHKIDDWPVLPNLHERYHFKCHNANVFMVVDKFTNRVENFNILDESGQTVTEYVINNYDNLSSYEHERLSISDACIKFRNRESEPSANVVSIKPQTSQKIT